jgi:acyl-CoA oxidase
MVSSDELPRLPLFHYHSEDVSVEQKTNLSHARARAMALSRGVTFDDILNLTPKFWSLCTHPIVTLDGGAVLLMSVQLNLGVGTIAPYVHGRPDLRKLVDDILAWRVRYDSDLLSYRISPRTTTLKLGIYDDGGRAWTRCS